MSLPSEDRDFEKHAKRLLDDSTDNLPAALQSRLTQARHRALEQKSKTSRWRAWLPQPVPGLALAGGLALALVFTLYSPTQSENRLDDLDLLATTDQLELYEDLEFYAWLAEEHPAESYETG